MKNNQPVTDTQRFLDPKRPVVTKTNLESIITYANPAFVEVSGFSREALLGQPHNVVRHPHMPPGAFADLWRTVKSGRPWQGMVKNRCKDGGYYWVNAYVTPITEQGKHVGYMSVRSAPSESQIRAAQALYQEVNSGKAAIRLTPPAPTVRFGWLLGAAVLLPVLVEAGLSALGVSPWIGLPVAGALAGAVLAGSLHALNRPLRQALLAIRRISEGDLGKQTNVRAARELNELLTNIESMRIHLHAVMADALAAASGVGAQAGDLTTRINEVTVRAHQQSDGVASVAAALEQLTVAMREIAEATDRGATYADAARSVTLKGVQQMDEVQQASDRIVGVVDAAQVTIRKLEAAVAEVGVITQTIKEVADQTKLLALNAAIEAARAGEQGKGFAVVADEVRKLSERTAASTASIARTITSAQEVAGSALNSMHEAVMAVGEGKLRVASTRDSLREVEAATEGIAASAHEVANVLAQQAQASNEVANNMERMSTLNEENSSSFDQVAAGAVRLATIAKELHELLQGFDHSAPGI